MLVSKTNTKRYKHLGQIEVLVEIFVLQRESKIN